MSAPTDTLLQSLAQAFGGGGYMVAVIFFAVFAGTCLLAIVSLAWHARWQHRERQRLQRELSRSVSRARSGEHGHW